MRRFKAPLLLLVLLVSASCATPKADGKTTDSSGPASPSSSAFCLIAKPIYWSEDDLVRHPDGTNPTLDQIKEANAIWKRLCGAAP